MDDGSAFFARDGDLWVPSELTRGPWDPGSQHAGPPAGLLAREIERLPADGPRRVGRITIELLRGVPISPLRVEAHTVRPGRSVELVEARLSDERGEVATASAWRLREAPVAGGASERAGGGVVGPAGDGQLATLRAGSIPPGPEQGSPRAFFPTGQGVGYHTAMEYRFVAGSFLEPGPATVWMRMRHPLAAGEEPTPLQRVMVAADSGNGVSATLDWRSHLFINVDLTVHLRRPPVGEWVCLEAVTIPDPDGVGITDTALYDGRGPIGRAAQTLLVAERDPA